MIKASTYCDRVFDGTHDSPKPSDTGYRLLTSKNIMNGYLNLDDAYLISEEDYNAVNQRSKVHQWDILFSMIGSVGNVCLITTDNIDFAIKNMGVFSCRDEYKAKWLYYFLQSPYSKKKIQNYLNGAVQKFVPLGWLRDFELPEFDDEKKKIVDVLWALESKIRLNGQICTELSETAQNIFEYWFLQYEFPDGEGKPYSTNGGKIEEDSEKKISAPVGWKTCCIENLISASKNGDWGAESDDGNCIKVNCFRGADFVSITSTYEMEAPVRYISSNNKDKLLAAGDLVIEISGGSPTQATGRIGYINDAFLERCKYPMNCSNFCKAVVLKNKKHMYWFYHSWKSLYESGAMFNYEGKTTGIKNFNFDQFVKDIHLAIPPDDVLDIYNELVIEIYERVQRTYSESAELASLKEYIQPMLIAGQITL